MTSAQLLRRIDEPAAKRETVDLSDKDFHKFSPGDYASSAGLTAYSCLKQKTCPICGNKGHTEHYIGANPATIFWCGKHSNAHIFELDDDTGTADRIQME